MSQVVAIKNMGQLPEAGRIRTGIKDGRRMKAIDTFRFTSVDRNAIEQLAVLYGGEVMAWKEPSANPPDQWQVITEASEIQVAIQPDSAVASYEQWTRGGRQRSCDGETVTVPDNDPNSGDWLEQPCICDQQGVLECNPKTRVNVLFPDISFAGTWRYESSGKNALYTLPSMLQLIDLLQSEAGLLPVTMALVKQKKVKGGQTRHYTVVQFRPSVTINEMLTGAGTYQAQVGSGTTLMTPSLPSPKPTQPSSEPNSPPPNGSTNTIPIEASDLNEEMTAPPTSGDDDIVDAELVEDDVPPDGMTKSQAMAYIKEHGGVMKKGEGGKWTVT